MILIDKYIQAIKHRVFITNSNIPPDAFNNIMQFSRDVIEETTEYDNHPIFSVVKLLSLKLQSNRLLNLISSPPDTDKFEPFHSCNLLFQQNRSVRDIRIEDLLWEKKIDASVEISLACDTVIPWPWNRDRLVRTITQIGNNKPWGVWKQSNYNHRLFVWLPMGLVWVHSGNHSISAGMLNGSGTISCEEIYDISKLYEYIHFDGVYFRRNDNNQIIHRCLDFEFACIFEIGRLIHEKGINYKGLPVY